MKMLLIATTALVCVTSLATANALPERWTGSSRNGLDTNGEFLCTYGFNISAFGDDSLFGGWKRAATPIIGKGSPINEIIVEDGPSSGYGHTGFRVAIYSSKGGKPDKELAAGLAAQGQCGRVKVPISSITLENAKKYWVVETALVQSSSVPTSGSNALVWVYDQRRTHGALSQSGSWSCPSACSHHQGAWTPIASGVPFARVKLDAEALTFDRPARPPAAGSGSMSPAFAPILRSRHEGGTPRYPP